MARQWAEPSVKAVTGRERKKMSNRANGWSIAAAVGRWAKAQHGFEHRHEIKAVVANGAAYGIIGGKFRLCQNEGWCADSTNLDEDAVSEIIVRGNNRELYAFYSVAELMQASHSVPAIEIAAEPAIKSAQS